MYTVKGYCAGILLFDRNVKEEDCLNFFEDVKSRLKAGEFWINFALNMSQVASEMCVNVYDESGAYRSDLSFACKRA